MRSKKKKLISSLEELRRVLNRLMCFDLTNLNDIIEDSKRDELADMMEALIDFLRNPL